MVPSPSGGLQHNSTEISSLVRREGGRDREGERKGGREGERERVVE